MPSIKGPDSPVAISWLVRIVRRLKIIPTPLAKASRMTSAGASQPPWPWSRGGSKASITAAMTPAQQNRKPARCPARR